MRLRSLLLIPHREDHSGFEYSLTPLAFNADPQALTSFKVASPTSLERTTSTAPHKRASQQRKLLLFRMSHHSLLFCTTPGSCSVHHASNPFTLRNTDLTDRKRAGERLSDGACAYVYEAALALRPLLAHASLWHTPRKDRMLTRQDVQDLQSRFEAAGVPKVARVSPEGLQTLGRYLTWLQEDGELAEQVADAWNAVVKRGGGNVVSCRGRDCRQ